MGVISKIAEVIRDKAALILDTDDGNTRTADIYFMSGVVSKPKKNDESIALPVIGSGESVAVAFSSKEHDNRYLLLKEGESVLFSDGVEILLENKGVLKISADKSVVIKGDLEINGDIEIFGDIKVRGTVRAKRFVTA